jgi:hypothetical protein
MRKENEAKVDADVRWNGRCGKFYSAFQYCANRADAMRFIKSALENHKGKIKKNICGFLGGTFFEIDNTGKWTFNSNYNPGNKRHFTEQAKGLLDGNLFFWEGVIHSHFEERNELRPSTERVIKLLAGKKNLSMKGLIDLMKTKVEAFAQLPGYAQERELFYRRYQ